MKITFGKQYRSMRKNLADAKFNGCCNSGLAPGQPGDFDTRVDGRALRFTTAEHGEVMILMTDEELDQLERSIQNFKTSKPAMSVKVRNV